MSQKQEFVNFMLKNKALLFGEFTLKSNRLSPYFFNLGCLNDGQALARLGQFYAQAIKENFQEDFDIVFGPAYKGIPLSVAIVDSLHRDFKINKKYCSNRKEEKTHGDKSVLLGAEIKQGDKIILVDDVLTTGQTKIEAVNLIKSIADVEIKGLIIALDRLEKDQQGKNAVEEFTNQTKIPVYSIISTKDILEYVESAEVKSKLQDYLNKYGV